MKTMIKYSLLLLVVIASTLATQAQVKIGSNPTVIEPQSNLEVEASTPNRQVKVDKTTGQLTIKDGTEGVGKILTSDAVGGASWQKISSNTIDQLPKMRITGGNTPVFTSNFQSQEVQYTTIDYSEGGMSKVGNGLRVPTTGYYQLNTITGFQNGAGCTDANALIATSLTLYVNGTALNPLVFAGNNLLPRRGGGWTNAINELLHLNANDVVTIKATYSINYEPVGCATNIYTGSMSLYYVP
ncbi:hypothetical protein [Spirosoma radiotolerans]|uniref:hypothetical protein n=1 Tax=Spirosoma radiotolerans TaxID=1379870 RepID=UPI0006977821|nr:hypothetical protein [Spirosoma radiotolerans]